ncbi:rhamnosyltransferase [Clostridia bacterium]|nr:rhamnosyltransferase [Clostridia bacterium]
MQVSVIIPTYKPDKRFETLILNLAKQTYPIHQLILMNTEEKYFEKAKLKEKIKRVFPNVYLRHLRKEDFDHGGTRNLGVGLSRTDLVLLMTQDAVPVNPYLVEELIQPFLKGEKRTAISYARQIAGKEASFLEKNSRLFNYPKKSQNKSKKDLSRLGIKTFFASNACAMYRKEVWEELQGFPEKTIFNEDMLFAAKAVQAGYRIAYCAKAKVRHFHQYTLKEQFMRNFDIGVSQAEYASIFSSVSSEDEGKKYVLDVLRGCIKNGYVQEIFPLVAQTGAKYLGYRLGKEYRRLPTKWVRALSMNKEYWNKE